MSDFPQELLEITEFLASQKELPTKGSGEDARRDSAISNKGVVNFLKKQSRWKINFPNTNKNIERQWYDLSVCTQDRKNLFVRIKTSSLKSADNTGCIGGFYYVLTGREPASDTTDIVKKLRRNLRNNDKNFYFLIIKKNNKKNKNLPKVFLCSLRTLKEINSSGDNLPFQCNWGENIEPSTYRSNAEMRDFLLKSYGKSLKLRAERYKDFKKCFPDMVVEEEEEEDKNAELDI